MSKINNTWAKGSVRALITIAITAVLWILVKLIFSLNLSFFNPINDALDNYQLTDLYFNIHRSSDHSDVQNAAGSDIVIIDINECRSRAEIAGLLNRIADAEPQLVALDVIFGNASSVSQAEDDSLLNSLRRLPNLVIAKNIIPKDDTTFTAESSFFADQQFATEAVINFEYGVVRHFTPLQIFGSDTLVSFTKCIADNIGIDFPNTTNDYLIDYTLPHGMILSSHEQWNDEYLKNKVILIGDLNDYRDQFVVPVTLKGETRQAGVSIHRQILATAAEKHLFRKVPTWIEIPVSAILIFLSTMLSYFIKRRSKQNEKMSAVAIKWLLNLMQVGFIVLAIVVAYCLFWGSHWLFSVKYIIVGFALIELIDKLLKDIKKWIPCLKFGDDD